MKRTFYNFYSNDVPEYIINISNAIKEKCNISLILSKIEGDEINSIEYIIDYLNVLLHNNLIKIYEDKFYIYCQYKYDTSIFEISYKYNKNSNLYKIDCLIK